MPFYPGAPAPTIHGPGQRPSWTRRPRIRKTTAVFRLDCFGRPL